MTLARQTSGRADWVSRGLESHLSIMLSCAAPERYGLIALLAGTEVVVPEAQRRVMDNQGAEEKVSVRQCKGLSYPCAHVEALNRSAWPSMRLICIQVDPFLPAYLSPAPPSLGKELRHLSSSLTTVLNVLFSIFGSAAAVYVASVTGAGYTRETAVILAVLAGVVVGIAEGILVWIFGDRLKKGREASRKAAREMARGSGAIGVLESSDGKEADSAREGQGEEDKEATTGIGTRSSSSASRPNTSSIRLRRKALHEDNAVA